MKQLVLGTAGHIDHGKTSLVKALTGIDTDRLKEEKERGITIELGFAHLQLPSGGLLGIVDVPGHEKFVKNMVAGATGIDLVALVIAADEGVMPQTREHLEICQLLSIRHGLVVLTKIDMVDQDWLALVKEDVSAYLSKTFLAGVPIVEVSSLTGQGIDTLIQVLDKMVQAIPEREAGHIFRVPIDRVFTMKGFGTVITGTTASGKIRTGDEVTIYPQGIHSRVRGLHVHNKEIMEVHAGLRTAINLQGLERSVIERGNVVASKDSLRPTRIVDVYLQYLSSAPRKLKNRSRVRFHTGTSEIIATVILLDRDILDPGAECFAQIRLDAPTAVLRSDRYVLRSYSPVRTVGGGEILNPLPKKRKRLSEAVVTEMKTLREGEPREVVEVFVASGLFDGLVESELSVLTNINKKRLDEILQALKAQKRLVSYDKEGGLLIHAEYLKRAREEILDTLQEYHRAYPLKSGLAKEELRSRTTGSRNLKLFNYLMNHLSEEGTIVLEKEVVRLRAHRITLAYDQEKARQQLEAIYIKGGLQPPYFKEVKDTLPPGSDQVLELMVKEGVLAKIKEDLYFHRSAIQELLAKMVDFLKKHGEITTPQFKDMTAASRKYAIPLIEYFDRSQVTVRVGDKRVLRKR